MRNTCSYCQRHFKRAEHLTRHLRIHTKERPFRCGCGATFSRRDLLTRHWRISKHGDDEVSPPEYARRGPAVDSPVNDGLPAEDGFLAQAHSLDIPTGAVIDNHHDDGLEVFLEFLNFMDGVGLPAHWSPTRGLDLDAAGSVRDSEGPDALDANGIGTPFSTWLPSAPAENEASCAIPLRDSVDSDTSGRTYVVTEAERSLLFLSLETFRSSIPDFKLPSRHALTRYLISFFEGFHSHLLFIHEPTFKPSGTPLELTLAMCSAGAQYCFERRVAEQLFHAANAIVFARLRYEETSFGPQIRSLIRLHNSSLREDVPSARRGDPWAPLDTIKTLLILVGYATWEVVGLLQQSFALRQLLVHCLRDIGLAEESHQPTSPGSNGLTWEQWIEKESARRSKLIAFCYVNVHSIAYDVHPMLWCSELHLRLPCSTDRWQARSASQWANLERQDDKDQMLFQEALSLLLYSTDEAITIQPNPSPLGNYVLLHALLQRIHIVRELSLHASCGAATMPAPELQIIGRGLRCWTLMWQQAPESGLNPNNKSGPVPFTSSALLGIAYVRLALNIGPFRHLELRDPSSIALGLTRLPNIERNDSLFSALLYSTHALSVPVRLGIDRVARSQAFFWSVQHALSGFECAVFLAKWLCSLHTPSQNHTAILFEDRILLWIRRIVEEAYAVVDFDEPDLEVPTDPFSLGLVVLMIWSRFFQGNTQWPFIVILGKSLQKHGESLQERRQFEGQSLLQ
ncbi:hypothetical protein P152DRAFT_453500 [Eremomyces bilateralis CBS 781.70]|uniref:C2H2-type domain-containing protein n=1 Tax=Eremomyces bilateralis CBS 781.70 TaxID=1392243 RepID=A0A6G1GGA3_9PEZI|nr:uncharacterized protein P152DRAFT_453500 [Eremomyces bilateralis CBS 781.70]KAF1816890.1 hypothetical protein P152DRAFT_453500 [Eremomyces bilateralis CBS 781.70]